MGRLGIAPVERVVVEEPVGAVLAKSVTHTFNLVGMMIEGLEQVITGRRPVDELGGPIKIAQFAGQTASLGWEPLIEFMARSEEHTSELQSLMRNSYAGLCFKKKNNTQTNTHTK